MNIHRASFCVPALTTLTALVGFGTVNLGDGRFRGDEEPPLRLTLEVDGKKHDVTLGRRFELAVGGRKLAMKVTAKPTRLFALGGIEFEYPSHMTFEADHETEGVGLWTLEGQQTTVMVQCFSGQKAAAMRESVLAGVADQFDKAQVKRAGAVRYELMGKKLQAPRLEITIGSSSIRYDFIALQGKDVAYVLMIMDSSDEDGHGAATKEVVKVLGKTLRLSAEKK